MPWDDFIDPDVSADAELGGEATSKINQVAVTIALRLLGIKALGDAFTDYHDPSDPNGYYKLVENLSLAFYDAADPDAALTQLKLVADSFKIGGAAGSMNDLTALIVARLVAMDTKLGLINTTLGGIAATFTAWRGDSVTALYAINSTLGTLVTETQVNA